jgi:hypothetical protein
MPFFLSLSQVTSIEKSISRGNKVPEVQITTLIELLMRHAVKLESIPAAGDSSSQKNIQVHTPTLHYCTPGACCQLNGIPAWALFGPVPDFHQGHRSISYATVSSTDINRKYLWPVM